MENEIKLSKEDDAYFALEEVVLKLKTQDEVKKEWIIERLEAAQKIIVDDVEKERE